MNAEMEIGELTDEVLDTYNNGGITVEDLKTFFNAREQALIELEMDKR